MDSTVDRVWTQAAFLDWVEAQEERYEFDGAGPVLMVGGTSNHNRIWRNLLLALQSRLQGGPCEAFGQDAGVETSGGRIRYPDAFVTCAAVAGSVRVIPGPVVVFEVPSPSSERLDRLVKVNEYAAVPSILHYIIVESSFAGMTSMSRSRAGDPWTTTALPEGGMLGLPEIGIELPVDEVYDRVSFD